jgi:hypothetical protein
MKNDNKMDWTNFQSQKINKTLNSRDKSNHKWTQSIELKIQWQIQP